MHVSDAARLVMRIEQRRQGRSGPILRHLPAVSATALITRVVEEAAASPPLPASVRAIPKRSSIVSTWPLINAARPQRTTLKLAV